VGFWFIGGGVISLALGIAMLLHRDSLAHWNLEIKRSVYPGFTAEESDITVTIIAAAILVGGLGLAVIGAVSLLVR